MEAHDSVVDQLERLARRIVAGDVVFFIGAGFSIDSERNTAQILIARLAARFQAIVDAVAASGDYRDSTLGELCATLEEGLKRTFSLQPKKQDEVRSLWTAAEANIGILADNYYLINDWMCSAYDSLLEHADVLSSFAADINRRENEYLRSYQAVDNVGNKWPMPPVDFPRFGDLQKAIGGSGTERAAAGKALFLETMGFENGQVMAGNFLATPEYVSGAYLGRLRARHFVLAWLAHEGLLPVVVSTNYDLLLEGAFRLAGMEPKVAEVERTHPLEPDAPMCEDLRWNRRLQNFTPISDATQFFSYGDGYQSALILKIHGCVYRYRYELQTPNSWRNVLPTMVFTFREVQNWREDSWSRDYLQSLLRTRTVAFAGYSTADPVIHDTFRSVYEEMARYRQRRYSQLVPRQLETNGNQDAAAKNYGNAFYFSVATKREFHALEILRASSLAADVKPPALTSHPNLVGFHFEGGEFPTLDEVMVWTFHLAYRRLQAQALTTELRRVYHQLFRVPCPDTEARALIESFDFVVAQEKKRAFDLEAEMREVRESKAANAQAAADRLARAVGAQRAELLRAVSWTACFHRNLLREYAAADLLVREPARGSRVHAAMRWPWYAALNEHADWGAWAVVVELALRRRSATWTGAPEDWRGPASWLEPVRADRPALLVPKSPGKRLEAAPKLCLSIEIPEVRMMANARESSRTLHMLPRVVLSLRGHAVPWRQRGEVQKGPFRSEDSSNTVDLLAPDPETVWQWALGAGGPTTDPSSKPAPFFGGTDVRPFGRDAARYR
jgi:SIR2-like domain